MAISDLYNTTLTVETVTKSDDGLGSVTESWATKHADLPCRQRTLAVQARTANDKGEFVVTDKFWLDVVAIDERTDRIVHAGKTYTIVSLITANDRTSSHHLQIQAKVVL